MKETHIITSADKVLIPAGITAPAWIPAINSWIGLFIGIFTLLYAIVKFIDAFYQWRHKHWKRRKLEEKGLTTDETD